MVVWGHLRFRSRVLPLLLLLLLLEWGGCAASSSGGAAQDAGTREQIFEILRGRYNYASADCAARILATNRGAKCPHAILQSQKDSYLLNLCAYDDKHIVLELCQDIRIDSLVIANFEYFSSMVKEFRVSVSKKYPPPPGGWRPVGSFLAENSKREQYFPVMGATMYARYLRIDFDTHYGNEYYCLLSTVRIYGKTMMEDFEESAVMGLPGRREPRGGPLAAAEIVPIQATVIPGTASTASADAVKDTTGSTLMTVTDAAKKGGDGNGDGDGSGSLTVTDETMSPTRSLDLMELFRQHREFCQATLPHKSPPQTPSDDHQHDWMGGSATFQENIFKAIYDRLYVLERNLTKTGRALEDEFRKINADLKFVREEVGITGGGAALASTRRSYRLRVLNHLQKRLNEQLSQLMNQVRGTLKESRSHDWLLMWVTALGVVQALALAALLGYGVRQGWLRSRAPSTADQCQTAMPGRRDTATPSPTETYTRSRSLMGGLSSQRSSFIIDETEQRVPITDEYRGASPARSDLIDTASRPLLLDESEPEIIDAAYLPSPLSTCSSVASISHQHREADGGTTADCEANTSVTLHKGDVAETAKAATNSTARDQLPADDGTDNDGNENGTDNNDNEDGIGNNGSEDGIDNDGNDDGIGNDGNDDGIDNDGNEDGIDNDGNEDGIDNDGNEDGIDSDGNGDGTDKDGNENDKSPR